MLLSLTMNRLGPMLALLPALVCIANANVCDDHLSRIKLIPFERNTGVDANYDALKAAGQSAVPCLIANVTNTLRKPNPRPIPSLGESTVGDTATYILAEITGVDTIKMLPHRYQDLYKEMGVLVVDKYLHDRGGNRRTLQNKLWHWYRTTYLPSVRKGATYQVVGREPRQAVRIMPGPAMLD
jgi:hypothetical protein